MTSEEAAVLRELFHRYRLKLVWDSTTLAHKPLKCDTTDLIKLCEEAEANCEKYPFDKMCRWLGFVQGVMASHSMINVNEERDYTRPLFHKLYGTDDVPSFGN